MYIYKIQSSPSENIPLHFTVVMRGSLTKPNIITPCSQGVIHKRDVDVFLMDDPL